MQGLRGKPAVVSVTAGPGGANTLNGIFGAWTDSIPVIVISGQVRTNTLNKNKKLRQLGDQEIDIIKIMTSLTKYSRLIKSSDNIEYIFNKAINLSLTGRMGPVWLDVPIDIQGKEYAEKKNLEALVTKSVKTQNNFKKLDTLMTKLQKSKRPVILAGNGIHLSNQEPFFSEIYQRYKHTRSYRF
jgi:acetolactate synthase-1/2/3 large subunit